MHGLTLEQETALAVCYMHQDSNDRDFTNLGISSAFIALREMGMIKMTTDIGNHLVFFQAMLSTGAEHYDKARSDRRRFVAIDDSADELIMALATQDKTFKESSRPRLLSTNLSGEENYHDLQDAGLLDIQWADDEPYIVTITNKGRSYAEGWFLDQMPNSSSGSENRSYMPMFSLVIRANPNNPIDLSRLFEQTDPLLSKPFMQGNTPDLDTLSKLPAILTREFAEDDESATATLGYIDKPSLNPKISKPIFTFPSKRLLELGITGKWGNTRTHWAICEGDPFKLFFPYALEQTNSTNIKPSSLRAQPGRFDSIAVDSKLAAVMMPFSEAANHDPVYQSIRRACIDAGIRCKRVDEIMAPNDIVDDIRNLICSAGIVIADLTGQNPNVMYELGFAHGHNKQVICIQEGKVSLPFDIGQHRTLSYKKDDDGLEVLTQNLTLTLSALVLSRSQ